MLCERCRKNAATARYSEVVHGKVSVRNICKSCLDALQEDPSTGFEIAGAPAAKRTKTDREPSEPTLPHRSCPACGLSLRMAIKAGRMGCGACYRNFGDAVDSQLRGLHVSLRHRGKTPRVDDIRDRARADLHGKRALLRTALKLEDYEKAAALRDDIKALETGLGATARTPGHN
ncbi:MAG TPA: UvrB/UvrC motif-containing protein [Candidatus Hydrogenedentes bacterium]|nr:UvrB/UvrC motif-containing protein [Candidatus Hydrogenedentota bacterium]HOS02326.1 UvrB/UvrC motif-containing protein [Candidatus Hydrogenedentota bacterium]